jgi:RNA polymerase sigma factor (sigma-70 family)
MSGDTLRHAVDHLRRLAGPDPADPSDGELLTRFVRDRDHGAFAALVERHGRLVFGACRRTLGDVHLAEDCFQSAFIALARQAASLHGRSSLAGWLYTVARRAARKTRDRTHRPVILRTEVPAAGRDPLAEISARELYVALDEEVARLPAHYREPVLLCCLEGLARDEAARRLGWSLNALRGRLERGRALLRTRLERRGLAAPAALGAVLVADGAADAVSPTVVRATIVGCRLGSETFVTGLTRAGLRGGRVARMRIVGAALFLAVISGAGLAVLAGGMRSAEDGPEQSRATAGPAAIAPGCHVDGFGDPLPEGAVARMGSLRLRHPGLHDFAFLPDCKTVVSAGKDGLLRFWDIASGRQVREARLPSNPGDASLLTRDGKLLAMNAGGKSTLLEVATEKVLKAIPPPRADMAFVTFSPDGKLLAEGAWDGTVRFHEWESLKQYRVTLPQRKIGKDSTYHGSFSPDGKLFAAGGGWEEALTVAEVATGKTLHEFHCFATTSRFSPDGKTLAAACMQDDKGKSGPVLRLFAADGGKELAQFPLPGEGYFFSLAFSPDGKVLACGFSDDSCVVDLASGRILYRLTDRPLGLSFSPDGKTLAAHNAHRLRFWNAATGKEFHEQSGDFGFTPVTAVSPDGKLLAGAGWMDQAVGLWDTASGRLLRRIPLAGEKHYVNSLSYSPDGKSLFAGQAHGFFQFWDAATGAERRTGQLKDEDNPNKPFFHVYKYQVVADGKHVATVDTLYDRTGGMRLANWDVATGKILSYHRHPASPRVNVWRADGRVAALAGLDGVSIVDTETGATQVQVAGVAAVALVASADFRLLAVRPSGASNDADSIIVLETATGKRVLTLPAGRPKHFAVSPDNRSLVTTDGALLRVFDLTTAKERQRWPLPLGESDPSGGGFVRALTMSPVGDRAFTLQEDGTALVWDTGTATTGSRIPNKAPDERQLAAWWADLAGDDAGRAYAAVWKLGELPGSIFLPFLREHMQEVPGPDTKEVRQLVKDLDSDSFDVREKAQKRLEELGGTAETELRAALSKDPSPDVKRRLETLLASRPLPATSPKTLRRLRAMQVVERLGSPEARPILADLAEGGAHPAEKYEARAALERIAARGSAR